MPPPASCCCFTHERSSSYTPGPAGAESQCEYICAESIAVSEDDLLAYYEDAKSRYLQDEQRRARHILIPFGDDEDAAAAKANELFARIEAGEPFADLAATHSADGGTASQGGDLGSLTRTQLPGELGSSIFAMNAGELDGPLKGDFGFHIVRLKTDQ